MKRFFILLAMSISGILFAQEEEELSVLPEQPKKEGFFYFAGSGMVYFSRRYVEYYPIHTLEFGRRSWKAGSHWMSDYSGGLLFDQIDPMGVFARTNWLYAFSEPSSSFYTGIGINWFFGKVELCCHGREPFFYLMPSLSFGKNFKYGFIEMGIPLYNISFVPNKAALVEFRAGLKF